MFTDPSQPRLSTNNPDEDPQKQTELDREEDPVFAQEQEHLSRTYETLVKMAASFAAKIKKLDAEVAADKEMLADELTATSPAWRGLRRAYAEYATANKNIDLYNATQELNLQNLEKTRLLLEQPYFAKVSLQYKPGDAPKDLYIGNAGMSDENYKRLVVDWRSPVAETYYNQENGPTSYVANGRTIKVDLKLRRQFDIAKDTLNAYFDTTVAIQDASFSRRFPRSAHPR